MRTRENGRRGKQTGTVLYKEILAVLLVLGLALLGGCNSGTGSGDKRGITIGKSKELPEDTPWNHGYNAIMETELGYYSNLTGMQCLRYYEKGTDATILLCNKPECTHSSEESCEARYHGMGTVNTLLYDGALYVLGVSGIETDASRFENRYMLGENGEVIPLGDESAKDQGDNKVSICLWKGALDGSSFDLVGEVASAENTNHERVTTTQSYANQNPDYSFIIHKGYAYIPYLIQFGQGNAGLRCGGLLRMDLKTGQTEELYQQESRQFLTPSNLAGVGDYVYFTASSGATKQTLMRYVLSEKKVETVTEYDKKKDACYALFSKDRIYLLTQFEKEGMRTGVFGFRTLDAKSLEELPRESILTEIPFSLQSDKANRRIGPFHSILLYEDHILLAEEEKILWYDLRGNLLAEQEGPMEAIGERVRGKDLYLDYAICKDKLYAIFKNSASEEFLEVYQALSCNLEDALQGKGQWEKAYSAQGAISIKEFEESTLNNS